jgi:hypothetical protein
MPATVPPTPGYAAPQSNGKALASLIIAIASFFFCQIGGVAAIILGRVARKEIKESQGRQTGSGLATAGEIIGWIDIALTVLIVIFVFLLIFGLILFGSQVHNIVCNLPIDLTPNP